MAGRRRTELIGGLVVLAPLAIASALVGLGGPGSGPPTRPGAVFAGPTAVAIAVARGGEQVPAMATADREAVLVTAAPEPQRRVRVRVCREFGGDAVAAFPPGTAIVQGDGWRRTLAACDPAEFTVLAAARELRFSSGLYEDVCRVLPAAGPDGVVDLGTVVLRTDVHIVLRLWHPPAGMPRDLVATTGFGGSLALGEAVVQWCGDHGEARLPASRSTYDLAIGSRGGDFVVQLPDAAWRAAQGISAGDCRTIDVDLGQLSQFAIRLAGVPTELRPHLDVRWYHGQRPRPIAFDRDGVVTLLGIPRDRPGEGARLWIPTATGGRVDLRSLQGEVELRCVGGFTTIVSPDEPLVGIAMRTRGDLPAFRLGLDRSRAATAARPMHVLGASQFAEARLLHVVGDDGRERLLDPDDLQLDGPMRWILPATAPANGTLVVRPASAAEASRFAVRAQRLDAPGEADVPFGDGVFRTDELPAGRVRVELWHRGGRVCTLADDVQIGRGRTVELAVELPAVATWQGCIDDWPELPPERQPDCVAIGEQRAEIDVAGRFSFAGPVGPPCGDAIAFAFAGGQQVAAVIADCDPCRCTLRLCAPAVRAISLRDGNGEPPHRLLVRLGMEDEPRDLRVGTCWLRNGERVRGAWLGSGADGSTQVAAWFERTAGEPPVPIAPMVEARWITVDVRRRVKSLAVRVHGPEGCPPVTVLQRPQATAVPVLVVAGTRAIEVELDGEVQRFAVPAQGLVVD